MKFLLALTLLAVVDASRSISAKSCSQLGAQGGAGGFGSPNVCAASRITTGSGNPNGHTCAEATDFESATAMCMSIGARLCTSSELSANEAKHSGCNLDLERVWASDDHDCPEGLATSQAGSADYELDHPITCSDKLEPHFVRCCADSCADPCANNPCGEGGMCHVPEEEGDDRQVPRMTNFASLAVNPNVYTMPRVSLPVPRVGTLGYGVRTAPVLTGMTRLAPYVAGSTCSREYTCTCDEGFNLLQFTNGAGSRCASAAPAPPAPMPTAAPVAPRPVLPVVPRPVLPVAPPAPLIPRVSTYPLTGTLGTSGLGLGLSSGYRVGSLPLTSSYLPTTGLSSTTGRYTFPTSTIGSSGLSLSSGRYTFPTTTATATAGRYTFPSTATSSTAGRLTFPSSTFSSTFPSTFPTTFASSGLTTGGVRLG